MALIEIKQLVIQPVMMIEEGSWGSRRLGTHGSTMTMYCNDGYYFIEWDIPAIETTEQIGLTFDRKRLTDYDGLFSLPKEAIKLIRQCGFVVPREFEDRPFD